MHIKQFILPCLLLFILAGAILSGCTDQQQAQGSGNTIIIKHKLNDITVHAHQLGQVTATCDAGQEIVSGGFAAIAPDSSSMQEVSYPLNTRVIVASYPSSPSTWTVAMLNRESSDTLLVAHVYCAPTTGTKIASAVGAANSTPINATCATGTQLTGGGFQITNIHQSNDVVAILSSRPLLAQTLLGWQVKTREARGSSTPSNPVTSYAVCTTLGLASSLGTSVTVSANAIAPAAATTGQGSVACQSTQLLLGAGFDFSESDIDGNDVPVHFYPDYTQTPPQWSLLLASLPDAGIEGGALNSGAKGVLIPVCGSVGV
jgi:hypothetical protein